MTSPMSRWARPVAMLAAISMVSACNVLPRTGPTKREIYAGSVQQKGDAFVVAVNDRVTRATAVAPALGFSQGFVNSNPIGSDTIRPGDTLGLTIWENVDDGLLAAEGTNATLLEEVQVDGAGFIFVPYAGRIRAAGNTPEAIRRIITTKLARVTVIRGAQKGTIWFQDLYKYPDLDIALRGGDKVLVEEDTRKFTALGATGSQSLVPFETQTLSGLEAIAQVGGLLSNAADPTGVFILRNEPAELANQVLGRDDLVGAQRMVYVLDLTQPNGMFHARDFAVRDGDTLYVTEAPFTQWDKGISALTGTLTSANTLADATGN